jgi:hypothetical protein
VIKGREQYPKKEKKWGIPKFHVEFAAVYMERMAALKENQHQSSFSARSHWTPTLQHSLPKAPRSKFKKLSC